MQSYLQKTYQEVLERVSDIVGEPSELENRLALCMGLYSPQPAYAFAHSADSAQGPSYVAFAKKRRKNKRNKGRDRRPKRKSSGSKPGN